MFAVLFVFKIIEAILGMFCLGFHMSGFLRLAVAKDFYPYCAIFVVLTLVAMFGFINIAVGSPPTMCMELSVSVLGAILYMFCAVSAMYHAEKDFYLMYLSDFEAPLLPFFHNSKAQSIAALTCGVMYMMHALLIYDIVSYDEDTFMENDIDDTSLSPYDPQLYLFSKSVERKLQKHAWFRQINGESKSTTSIQTV